MRASRLSGRAASGRSSACPSSWRGSRPRRGCGRGSRRSPRQCPCPFRRATCGSPDTASRWRTAWPSLASVPLSTSQMATMSPPQRAASLESLSPCLRRDAGDANAVVGAEHAAHKGEGEGGGADRGAGAVEKLTTSQCVHSSLDTVALPVMRSIARARVGRRAATNHPGTSSDATGLRLDLTRADRCDRAFVAPARSAAAIKSNVIAG